MIAPMPALAGTILILTGPPGAGKSTTAQALAAGSEEPAVHLHSDDFWHFIRSGSIPPWLPEADRQNGVVIDVLAGAAAGYAAGGYFVIVDGIVGPWFLPAFARHEPAPHYLVLRPSLASAIERCARRGGDTLSDPGPIGTLHRQFSDLGTLERHAIDTAGQSAEETLAAVRVALASGRFRLDAAALVR